MENPIVEKGLIGKIKNFSTKKNKDESITTENAYVYPYLIGMNNSVNVCAKASAICWDKKLPDTYDEKAEYVGKRVRVNHTSVLEHSNFVMYLRVGKFYESDLLSFLDTAHYVYTRSVPSDSGTCYFVLIGGSLRAFGDLFKEADDLNNIVLKSVRSILYQYSRSEMFEDICNLGLMDKTMFAQCSYNDSVEDYGAFISTENMESPNPDLFEIISMDSPEKLYTNLYQADPEAAAKFTTYDLIKFCTVTINFKDMSRIITQQLTRHRNGITQESMRYVDYSNSAFNSPAKFNSKYQDDHKYTVRFGPSGPMHMTLQEIGDSMCSIYGMLNNPTTTGKDYALAREDARAFLPSNVKCRKIFITFTYKNLLKFLNLREDKAAQAEIRMYATVIGDWFRSVSKFSTKELCDLYTQPRLKIEDPIKIDVDEGIKEETVHLTEEDYEEYMKRFLESNQVEEASEA